MNRKPRKKKATNSATGKPCTFCSNPIKMGINDSFPICAVCYNTEYTLEQVLDLLIANYEQWVVLMDSLSIVDKEDESTIVTQLQYLNAARNYLLLKKLDLGG